MPSRAKLIEPHFTSFNTLNAQNNQSTVFPQINTIFGIPKPLDIRKSKKWF